MVDLFIKSNTNTNTFLIDRKQFYEITNVHGHKRV